MGPASVLRQVLGVRLAEMRAAAGVGRDEAAKALDVNEATIRRMEAAEVALKPPYLQVLLRLYGQHDEKLVADFTTMARQAEEPGWWHGVRDKLPDWFGAYVVLEDHAVELREYAPHFVPGPFQTPEYARAILRVGFKESEEELDRRVQARVLRRDILHREEPPTLVVVLEESVLRRPVGGADVMRGQIDFLLEIAESDHISLRVLPTAVGVHMGAGIPFTFLRFQEREIPDTVYAEGLASANYYQRPEEREPYLAAHLEMCAKADAAVDDVRQLLHHLRKEYE